MFWFMLIALVVVVAAVAMAVLGDGGALKDADPDRLQDRLPPDRPLLRSDIDAVRLPVAVRGYRMLDVDEVLDRLGAELAERDARIAELETSLAGVQAVGQAHGATLLKEDPAPAPSAPADPDRADRADGYGPAGLDDRDGTAGE
ncbi:DivIVA domain-containing protein [Actinacidiphila sp. ITFR-21]|uniref:DivIVA domain-containing protein n=1 Tax=Actinacidiphila sp. ITFR-21 TaxID=3075199 RepID=UPI00288976D7|nr:DivIVA domain-containing protein [Streptomyces sp. ITFR-21]WNI19766.1 DivIVA domain-containing protein [Streptomyces sp. ITFR-21]